MEMQIYKMQWDKKKNCYNNKFWITRICKDKWKKMKKTIKKNKITNSLIMMKMKVGSRTWKWKNLKTIAYAYNKNAKIKKYKFINFKILLIVFISKYLKMKTSFVITKLISSIKNKSFSNCRKKSRSLMRLMKSVANKSRN